MARVSPHGLLSPGDHLTQRTSQASFDSDPGRTHIQSRPTTRAINGSPYSNHDQGKAVYMQSFHSLSSQPGPTATNIEREQGSMQAEPNTRVNSDSSKNGYSAAAGLKTWSERQAVVPRSNLTVLDVAALIINKMIGTGIFTTPGYVLAATKSKPLGVALWAVGGLWSALFLLVYLEFGTALPFNGGELIYLDEMYRRPELLITILFSGYFLCLANSYGNATQFAKHVLLTALPKAEQDSDLDPRLVRYIAISVITLSCLIHYFSGRAGLFLNKLVAWYKALLLVVIFAAGMVWKKKNVSLWSDDSKETRNASDGMGAMVLVFYAYQGWENANYVAGEIRSLEGRTPRRTLTLGAFLGVITVWILYIIVSISMYTVLDFNTLTHQADIALALVFGPKVFGSSTGLKICMAMSAFGNILAVTYTSAKVKQTIAIQRILPFWRYLQHDADTPKGALVLHWINSVIFVAAAPTSSAGYAFAIGLFTYGHIFFSMCVTLGLFGLESRMREQLPTYRLLIFRKKWILYTIPPIFAAGNALILVLGAREHNPGEIPRFWRLVILVIILAASFLYWAAIRISLVKVSRRGVETTIGEIVGVKILVYSKDSKVLPVPIKDSIAETLAARIDGSKRRIDVEISGFPGWVAKQFRALGEIGAKWLF